VIDHIIVLVVCLPLIIGLGIMNTQRKFLTSGEVRFWGVCIFVAAEFVYLGVS